MKLIKKHLLWILVLLLSISTIVLCILLFAKANRTETLIFDKTPKEIKLVCGSQEITIDADHCYFKKIIEKTQQRSAHLTYFIETSSDAAPIKWEEELLMEFHYDNSSTFFVPLMREKRKHNTSEILFIMTGERCGEFLICEHAPSDPDLDLFNEDYYYYGGLNIDSELIKLLQQILNEL